MRRAIAAVSLVLMTLIPAVSFAQTEQSAEPRTAARMALGMVASIEKQLTGIATEMPEDKYAFAPTEGAFRGVRDFGEQIKHAAAVNHLVAATLLGERVTADMSDERGPDAAKTKAQVLKYLQESFAALGRAAAAIDETNAFAPIKGPFGSASDTRLGLIVLATVHSSNHYGQVVEYLRMHGLVPPRTQ